MNDDPQRKLREAALAAGVTMTAPETVFLSEDTVFGKHVTIEPFVVFGPGVTVADGATIHAFTHFIGAEIGAGSSVGPYARLRPGSEIGAGAKIGNFVEIKAAAVGVGAKVNHLSYVGDADVGERANIGAGAITCNYDGFAKHKTTIGKGAIVGSNVSLVAPVSVGEGAYVGSGSVITRDVPDDAMALERGPQANREGGAARYRKIRGARQEVERRPAAGFVKLST
jgi:bifunctional UDP-N-acetylglucosamine pyrophosphorylase/glucosamine-1-phosphate N-acetyltransferase